MRDWAKRHDIKDFSAASTNSVCHTLLPEKGFVHPGCTIIKILTVNGATGKVIEFVGLAINSMGMAAHMTLCNTAVEAGATCGI